MDSAETLILLAHPRSGSSSLYQILQLHPSLNIIEEPFNENYTRWQPNNKDYRSEIVDTPSLDIQLNEIFATYNGLKLLAYQLPNNLLAHLLQRPNSKIVFLRRKNLLQSVVSVQIAHQTQLWKKWEQSKPLEEYYQQLQPLNIRDIQLRVAELDQHLSACEMLVDTLPHTKAIKLTYEALYFSPPAQQAQQLDALWAFLGVPALEAATVTQYLQPAHAKINSAATYNLLPNLAEIEQHCGNDITGWLYK